MHVEIVSVDHEAARAVDPKCVFDENRSEFVLNAHEVRRGQISEIDGIDLLLVGFRQGVGGTVFDIGECERKQLFLPSVIDL